MPAHNAADGSSATAAIVQEVLAQLAAGGQLANLGKSAARGRPTGSGAQRGDDWRCPRKSCGYLNFARRHACHACGLSRRGSANGQPRGQQQPPKLAGATAGPGKNGATGSGGGVTANRTYSSVVRQPVQLQEFIRRPGGRAADCMPSGTNSQPNARRTWADISEEDPATVVGNCEQAAADLPEPHDDTEAVHAVDAEPCEKEDSLEHLRAKLAKRKEVLELMDSVGYKKGEAAYDSASQEIATLTAQIAELDPKREKPYAVALLHAQKALDRATNARAKLDVALDEIIKEYETKLELHVDKVTAADERVAIHTKKVAELKESIGPRPPPKELGGNLLGAADQIKAYSADLSVIFELAKSNPGYNQHAGKVENCENLLNALHKVLVDSGGALKPKDENVVRTKVCQNAEVVDDDMVDDDVDSPAQMEMPAAPKPRGPTPAGPPAAEAAPGAGSSDPPASGSAPPPPQPSPPAVANGCSSTVHAPAPTQPVAGTSVKEKVMAAVASNPGVVRIRESMSKAKTGTKAKSDKGKGANGTVHAGGGTATPTPEPMADTSTEAQEGERVVEDGSAAAVGA